ncbi:MAG: DNA-directed RNA polymerase subunit alpha [Elusimicrobia bacterium]|nr:DNA-directed RNA polymerase subunit alpha [Elusimicrobiota bacterium]
MTSLGLVLPQKLETDSASTETYGKFIAEPFEKGYGHTVGHSLRRILLSSLEGAAVTSVRIKGAPHEFSSLKGVQEDVITLIQNLKQLRFRLHTAGPETLSLKKKGGEVKGKHIDATSSVEVLNPEHVIAHLDAGGELDIELEIGRGRGFVTAEKLKREGQPVNTIPVDALFSPVSKVHYEVEYARVGQVTDYDKLILEVWTDGSVSPTEAVARASEILRSSVHVFLPAPALTPVMGTKEEPAANGSVAPAALHPVVPGKLKDMVDQPVEMIELTVRASNCLKVAKIKTIGELISKTEEELLGFKNFGKKSLEEIKERLTELGMHLGMLATATTGSGESK